MSEQNPNLLSPDDLRRLDGQYVPIESFSSWLARTQTVEAEPWNGYVALFEKTRDRVGASESAAPIPGVNASCGAEYWGDRRTARS